MGERYVLVLVDVVRFARQSPRHAHGPPAAAAAGADPRLAPLRAARFPVSLWHIGVHLDQPARQLLRDGVDVYNRARHRAGRRRVLPERADLRGLARGLRRRLYRVPQQPWRRLLHPGVCML